MKLHYALLLGALALSAASCSSKKDDPQPQTPEIQPLQLKDATYNVDNIKTTPEKVHLFDVGDTDIASLNLSEAVLATGPIKTIDIKGDQIVLTGDLGVRTYSINAQTHEIYRPATGAMPMSIPMGTLALTEDGHIAVKLNITGYGFYKLTYDRRQKAAGKEMDLRLARTLDQLAQYTDPMAPINTDAPSVGFASVTELQGTLVK